MERGRSERREPLRVEVIRNGQVESVHDVDLAVVGPDREAVMSAGRPEATIFARSTLKPFQALPLLADGVAERYGLTEEELALCCGSHSGEAAHVAVARSILGRIGLDEEVLACGPHEPFSGDAARALREAGREPGRVHNNCSGKHAGMLALARGHGWPVEGYQAAGHPVQDRVLDEVAHWSGVDRDRIGRGVDGCGVVTLALPLSALAWAWARLATEAAVDRASPASRLMAAMVAHPFLLAGSKRLCTAIGEATSGGVIAKVGAEGVYVALSRERRWGIALKARDGARRAAESALVAVLESLGLLAGAGGGPLERCRSGEIRNTRGEVVGAIRARLEVTGAR